MESLQFAKGWAEKQHLVFFNAMIFLLTSSADMRQCPISHIFNVLHSLSREWLEGFFSN
jgi:hypothetical protein